MMNITLNNGATVSGATAQDIVELERCGLIGGRTTATNGDCAHTHPTVTPTNIPGVYNSTLEYVYPTDDGNSLMDKLRDIPEIARRIKPVDVPGTRSAFQADANPGDLSNKVDCSNNVKRGGGAVFG